MNYLAHAYLSFNDADIQIGNLIGDFVKGRKYDNYAEKIKTGILLHRKIDHYTDTHPLINEAIQFFRPHFKLSGGIFIDILFDHFLANDVRYFEKDDLLIFSDAVYKNLDNNKHLFSEEMQYLFHYMSKYNWLASYKDLQGLSRSINGICKRHPILGDGDKANEVIVEHYDRLQLIYQNFFPQLKNEIGQ